MIVGKCDTGKREVSTRNIIQPPNTKSPTENSDIRIVVDRVPLEPPGEDLVPRTDDNNINHPSGIKNIGATCYMNSIIQSINPMMDHNHSNRVISTLLTSDPMLPIAKELSQLCLKVNRYRSVISPIPFWKSFTELNSDFRQRKPHDANEFFVALLNSVPNKMLSDKFCYKIQQSFFCNTCGSIVNIRLETRYNLIVKCDKKPLSQLITESISPEVIKEGKCASCSKEGLTRRSSIVIFPSYFAVCIKRFIPNGTRVKKISTPIRDPLSAIQVADKSYLVTAIVCHTGDPNTPTGHYINFFKDKQSDNWWRCNDSVVSMVNASEVAEQAQKGYIFFVEQS